MKTFEEWWATLETREQHRLDKGYMEEAWTAGAESSSEEIAKRDERIKEVEQTLWSREMDLNAKNFNITEQAERIAELEEREQILVRANSSANLLNNALAAQNQQMVAALKGIDAWDRRRGFIVPYKVRDPIRALLSTDTPDLASPALNRAKAEALRSAADEFGRRWTQAAMVQKELRAMADAIEKGEKG